MYDDQKALHISRDTCVCDMLTPYGSPAIAKVDGRTSSWTYMRGHTSKVNSIPSGEGNVATTRPRYCTVLWLLVHWNYTINTDSVGPRPQPV